MIIRGYYIYGQTEAINKEIEELIGCIPGDLLKGDRVLITEDKQFIIQFKNPKKNNKGFKYWTIYCESEINTNSLKEAKEFLREQAYADRQHWVG